MAFGLIALIVVGAEIVCSCVIAYAIACVAVSAIKVGNGCNKPTMQIEKYVHGDLFCPKD